MANSLSPPVLGTETEFGITVRNQGDFNPVTASSLVVNAYRRGRRLRWSMEEETPERDARGDRYAARSRAAMDDFLNAVLGNGARLYVDHAHPEYSTPECLGPRQAALYDKAGEVVLHEAARAAEASIADGRRVGIYKNNSDGKGNSYGAHENYLVSRDVPFGDIVAHLTGFLVSRQIFTGSGKVGAENGRPRVGYQITQRADFFEERVGLETTLKRPIINTRDEPHGDPKRFRRLHVIIGDATRSEIQTYLKLGSTSLLLRALEAGAAGSPLLLSDPVSATWQVSHDTGLTQAVALEDGSTATALALQWEYLERLAGFAGSEEDNDVISVWEEVLQDLERDVMSTADRLDWVAKRRIIEAYRTRDGLAWDDPKLKTLDLQYHDVDPTRGLYDRLVASGRIRRMFTDEEVRAAVNDPPPGTRAYFRGRCVDKYGAALVSANWDSLVFDVGESTLRRVPMMDPLRGTREMVSDLIDESPDAAALLANLGGAE